MAGIRVALVVASALVALLVGTQGASAGGVDTRPEFTIAVLGDSYASGEGSPDVHGRHSLGGDLFAVECFDPNPLDATPTCFTETWWSPDSWFPNRKAVFPQQDDPGWQTDARRCHRSTKGPATHAGMLIADRFPDVRVTILNFACGGSKITDGILVGWSGAEPPGGAANLPSQLKALDDYAAATDRDVDAIVVNIGGNDARFADLVIHCLLVDPVNDCANDQLLRDVGALVVDGAAPAFPDPATPLSERYRIMDAAIRNAGRPAGIAGLVSGRPDEVYLTTLPNPSHDAPPADSPVANPEDFCDGTQSQDPDYDNAKLGEAIAMENLVRGMNEAMGRAATAFGWILLPQLFELARDHGVCADGASFFRTNADALRIQGDEGLVSGLPGLGPFFISAGIAHQNEAGYAARATVIADVVEEHVRMAFRAPTLTLDRIEANAAFTLTWADPSSLHVPETRWELELARAGQLNPERRFSDSSQFAAELSEVSLASGTRLLTWRVPRTGELTLRVRGCRATRTGFYCGPFSNAVQVSTTVPGTPVDLRRVAPLPPSSTSLRVTWAPGVGTPAGVRYEVRHGAYGPVPCPSPPFPRGATCGLGIVAPTTTPVTGTVFQRTGLAAGTYAFAVRACSTAGCSAFTPLLVTELSGIVGPVGPRLPSSIVGTFGLRAPAVLPAGKPSLLEVEWRTPRRWTDLDRVELVVRDGRRLVGTIRFTQADGVLWIAAGGTTAFGHPDADGRIAAGPLALDLGRSAVVRFGETSKRVAVRLALVPGRALRGKTLSFALGGRDDRGRTQAARPAGGSRVR